jgi:perosamine synthetase
LESGWTGLGPKTGEFEEKISKYLNSDYFVALNSGTSALHLAILSLQLKPSDEVIVPPITFVSSVSVVNYVGATPVFCDVEPDTMNLNPLDLMNKISDRTKAVICVHLAGHPCDMDVLHEICDPLGIVIIQDAAHACGAEYKGQKIGSSSDLTCFSFHTVKNLSCGEGGGISTNNQEYNKLYRQLRWLGIDKSTFSRTDNDDEKIYNWQYYVNRLGYKYHMSDINAAIGIVQLAKLDRGNAIRKTLTKNYNEAFADLDWLETPIEKDYANSSNHLYVIKVPNEVSRNSLIKHLKDNNIAPGVHYYPINLHPFYKNSLGETPVANEVWKRIISLPLFPDLTEDDQTRVIETVRNFKV